MGTKYDFAVDMFLHGFILFMFLTIFFLLYVSKLSTSALQSEIDNAISSGFQELKTQNNTSLSNLPLPYTQLETYYSAPDEYKELNNKWVQNMLIVVNVALFIMLLLIILIPMFLCDIKINIGGIILSNLVTFICIGLIEYLFFTHIALKYVPTPPSLLTSTILTSLKNYVD